MIAFREFNYKKYLFPIFKSLILPVTNIQYVTINLGFIGDNLRYAHNYIL
jgi:hypothetical protein